MPARLSIIAGALLGLTAVAMQAALAHTLPARLDEASLALVRTAAGMQLWHAIILVVCALIPGRAASLAGAAFLAGTVIFCFTLYTHALLAFPLLSGAAPVGGTLLMLGWLLLAFAGFRFSSPAADRA